MSTYYPPVSFIFKVSVDGISGQNEGSFQEVSGLRAKLTTEDIKEGGENRFVHRLPQPPKYENLVLKRGFLIGSPFMAWVQGAVQNFTFSPKTVIVSLLDENLSPLASWNFFNAYPIGLQISDLKASDNAITLETLEIAYDYFTRIL